ncbi:MAG TPA: succinate dehydrogenase cytochrome b subunit [Bacteroidales bacterium]|nr:succinate dehydrogenase cytochrome b subunit [Bacteroidales bacterium]
MSNVFSSSLGKKLIMSLAGLFLILFLLVHLGINSLLILSSSTEPFNVAANFMATNIVIKVFEVVLFGGLLLHIIYGLILQIQNWMARGSTGYKKTNYSQTSFFSKYMIHTAAIIFIFLIIHLMDFYFVSKLGHSAGEITLSNGVTVHDLGSLVIAKFHIGLYVIGYIIAFLILGFHLHHGFQSAFQTLGMNHNTYTPVIKGIGVIYSIFVTAGFIIIPLVIYYS